MTEFAVEDGSGLAGALSYVSLSTAWEYHLVRRNDTWLDSTVEDETRTGSLIRATTWLDSTYGSRFPGYRRRLRAQRLEWPRVGAYTQLPDQSLSSYCHIPDNEIPREVVEAVCEAALRDLRKPGSLSPDLKQGGSTIQSVGAGSTRVSYFAGSSANTIFQDVDNVLSSLLVNTASPLAGRVRRG